MHGPWLTIVYGHGPSPEAAAASVSANWLRSMSQLAVLISTMLTVTILLSTFHSLSPRLLNVRQTLHRKRRSQACKRVARGSDVVQADKKGSVLTAE